MSAAAARGDSDIIFRGSGIPLRILRSALASGRIAHAYLFKGPAGAPLDVFALWFAKGLLCDSGKAGSGEPCGQCWSCRNVLNHTHPDLVEIEKDGNTIKIKASHDILKEALARPYRSKRKVFIVKDAEDMTVEAANALLKVLEEPPPYVTFILTAENLKAIPETIISRCQTVPFRKMPKDVLADVLVELHGASRGDAVEAASQADGSLARALRILAGDLPGPEVLRLLQHESVVDLAQKYAKTDAESRLDVLLGLEVELVRRLRALTGLGGEDSASTTGELDSVYRSLSVVEKAKERLRGNVNPFLTFSVLFMDLSRMLREGERHVDSSRCSL